MAITLTSCVEATAYRARFLVTLDGTLHNPLTITNAQLVTAINDAATNNPSVVGGFGSQISPQPLLTILQTPVQTPDEAALLLLADQRDVTADLANVQLLKNYRIAAHVTPRATTRTAAITLLADVGTSVERADLVIQALPTTAAPATTTTFYVDLTLEHTLTR